MRLHFEMARDARAEAADAARAPFSVAARTTTRSPVIASLRHGGNGVYRWNGREWDMTDGASIRIAAAPSGLPWLVNIRGGVYPRHVML
jgi:hypothetical protein